MSEKAHEGAEQAQQSATQGEGSDKPARQDKERQGAEQEKGNTDQANQEGSGAEHAV